MDQSQEQAAESVSAIKGFGPDWKCRGYQFEVGGTYKHDGTVKACSSGFHAIEGYPMEVFGYYAPADSKYADVTVRGKISRHDEDSKVAGAELSVHIELKIPDIIARSVRYILNRIESTKTESNTGYQSAATNTGDRSAATNTGDQSAATAGGKHSVALASGFLGKAKGIEGAALFLVLRDENASDDRYGRILFARALIVGQDGIKADTFYMLNEAGEPVETE